MKMYRTWFAVTLGALIATAPPVSAQTGGSKDLKKLEAEIAQLRDQIREVEAALKKSQAGPGKKDEKGFGKKEFGKGGPGKGEPGEMKKGFGPPGGPGFGGGGKGPPGGPGMGGFGAGAFGGGFGKGPGFGPPGFGPGGKVGTAKPGTAEWHEQRARMHMQAARELRKAAALERSSPKGRGPGGKGAPRTTSGFSFSGSGSSTSTGPSPLLTLPRSSSTSGATTSSGSSIEQRLEQLQRAIEELRRDLKQGPQKKVAPSSK